MSGTTTDIDASTVRIEALLLRAIPWLLRQQLPTGELPCWQKHADRPAELCPYPYATALASQALACLDSRSPLFAPALFDLIPAPSRAAFRHAVVTLRWRMRAYLAMEESSNSTWRLHGRLGWTSADLLTTASAAMLLWEDRPSAAKARVAAVRRLLRETETNALGRVLGLHFLRLAGAAEPLDNDMPDSIFTNTEPDGAPLLAWAMWQAERDGSLLFSLATWQTLQQHMATSASGRLQKIVALACSTDCPARTSLRTDLLSDPEPPWRWPHDALRHDVSSPAATLALLLCALGHTFAPESGRQPGESE